MSIQNLRERIGANEAEIACLQASETALLDEIVQLEAEIASIQKLIDYFDEVDDFSRATHDLDVAEAALNAFSRYCAEKASIEEKAAAVSERLWDLQQQIDALEVEVDGLEDKAMEIEDGS